MSVVNKFGVSLPSGRTPMKNPKPKYRFRVLFFGFGANGDGDFISLDTNTCGSPSAKWDPKEVHAYNSVAHYKGKESWNTIDISIRDSVGNQSLKAVANQLRREFDTYNQESRTSASQYKFEMWIQSLDGSDTTGDGLYGGTLHTWVCQGCMIVDFKSGDYDYSSSDFIELGLTIQPDVCFLLDENGNPLGDPVAGSGDPETSVSITVAQTGFDMSAAASSNFFRD